MVIPTMQEKQRQKANLHANGTLREGAAEQ